MIGKLLTKNNNPEMFVGPVEKQEQIIIQEDLKHIDQMEIKQPISQNYDDEKNNFFFDRYSYNS